MKVSIITTTFNSADTIKASIESVRSQTYPFIEHILIDGASTDETLNIARKISPDLRIISESDNGIYDALNKGIKMASGDIIGVLHSDDFYASKDIVESVIELFQNNDINSCYGDLCYVAKSNPEKIIRYWRSGEFNIKNFEKGWMPPHPTFFVRKEVYDKYGLFDLSYKISADYELMIRFLYKHSISVGYIERVMVNMRVGGKSNKNIYKILTKMAEDYKIIKQYKLGGFNTLLAKNFQKLPQFLHSPRP
ncbi:MAG: glycosyltransferase [Elusimicrobia bacterium]|nr:glycosyltransferase [Elusimicrobiota bacterium]